MFFTLVKEPNAYDVQIRASLNKLDTINQALTQGGRDFVLKQDSPDWLDATFIYSIRILFLHICWVKQ